MFTKPTVFVLGAGVSVPFGFPTSVQLKEIICKTSLSTYPLLRDLLIATSGGNVEVVDRFVDAFRKSDMYSIDVWLEANQKEKDLLDIGRRAIAAIIMNAETRSMTSGAPIDEDWYAWLWSKLWTPEIEDISSNKVSFITFNYDRLLEWKLWQQITNTYLRASSSQHAKAFAYLVSRIVHVHGTLMNPKQPAEYLHDFGACWLRQLETANSEERDYLRTIYGRHMMVYPKTINIVCENPNDNKLIELAKSMLNNESRLVFLGFSFDRRNVLKLGLDDFAKKRGSYGRNKDLAKELDFLPIVGTGMGIMRGEQAAIREMFNDLIALGPDSMDAVSFCRSHVRPS